MRRPVATMAALGALFAFAPSRAADAPINYMILGEGALSCGTWTSHRHSADAYENAMTAWVLGFITAGNSWESILHRRNLSEGTDSDGLFGWIDNYCTAHPLEDLSSAAMALELELINRHEGAAPK